MADWKRLIFWEYRRTSLPYDIIVLAILAFIFLTPREFFRDSPKAPSVVLLPAESGANVYWMEADMLAGVPEQERLARATQLVRKRTVGHPGLARLAPIYDQEGELKGYMAYTKP